MIVAVGAEAVDDAVEGAPRMEVREDEVVPGVEELRVGQIVDSIAERGAESLTACRRQDATKRVALLERHGQVLALANVEGGAQHLLLGRRVREEWAGDALGADFAPGVAP